MNESRLEEIHVVVGPDGKVTVKVIGMKGDSCQKATKNLEALIGEVTERVLESTPIESFVVDGRKITTQQPGGPR